MPASLFKRLTSSFLDLVVVIVVVYGLFFLGGQDILQNRVPNYDVLNADYSEIMEVYNADLDELSSNYDAALTLADDDEALIEAAAEEYRLKQSILNAQNTSDIIPYNTPLTQFIVESINFFVIGFVVLMTILSVAMMGKTPGRRLLKLELQGRGTNDEPLKPSIISVFLHDSVFKYLLIGGLLVYNLLLGLTVLLVGFILDVILITFTRKGSTIRDYVSGIKVYNT